MYGFHTRNQLENQNLQVSLHSSDQLERNHLIPWGKPSSDGYLPGEKLPFLTVWGRSKMVRWPVIKGVDQKPSFFKHTEYVKNIKVA